MMTGSKTNLTTAQMKRETVLAAVRATPASADFVWDGKDDEDRPATPAELQSAVAAYRRGRGRPAGSGNKEQVALRIDLDVLAAFRASGTGWQTRMNAVLREAVETGRG